MARRKIKAEPVLKDWAEVDSALHEIALIESRVSMAEARINKKIQDLKEELAKRTEPDLQRHKRLEKDIEEFSKAHMEDLGKLRSKRLYHGKISFHRSSSIRFTSKAEEVVAALERRKLDGCLIVKKNADKNELAKLSDDVLSKIGAKRTLKDEFGYEIDWEACKVRQVA